MPHARLDSRITRSSLWREPEYVRCVWIAILANKDENGYVEATYEWLRGESNLTEDDDGRKFATALECLESPDPISKNKEFEGKRIIRVDGGWLVTGHEKYRLREDEIREGTRLRVARFRENLRNSSKNDNVTSCNVTRENVTLPPVSVSVSVSDSSLSLKDSEIDKRLERNIIPPKFEIVNKYCIERKNGISAQDFIDFYTSKGWMVGKNKMRDWQASVRTWEKNRYQKNNQSDDSTSIYSKL
jgi:hypothetical protein